MLVRVCIVLSLVWSLTLLDRKNVSMATNKNSKGNIEIFESEEVVSVHLAKYISDLSDIYCKKKGSFTLVLSGGSLIDSLRKLVELPYIESVDWSNWHVFWLDERVVAKDDVLSNYKLAYDGFLSKVPIPPSNIYPINGDLAAKGEAEAAADDYEAVLKHLVERKTLQLSNATGFPKFDLQLLGMGPDGHVASLFPRHPLVHENKRWVTFIKDSPKPPPKRITFTFPVINSSSDVALVVTGADLANAVRIALGNSDASDLLPVQRVSPEGELTWFLDKDAASKL